MADKEERILIASITDYTLSNIDNDTLFEGKIAPHCANVATRQEAIEKIGKALCHRHCPEKVCTSCDEWEKYGTKEDAEAALNALLNNEE